MRILNFTNDAVKASREVTKVLENSELKDFVENVNCSLQPEKAQKYGVKEHFPHLVLVDYKNDVVCKFSDNDDKLIERIKTAILCKL